MSAERGMRNGDLAPAVFALPKGEARLQPDRAKENSPAFQRWVSEREENESRQGRQKVFRSWHVSFHPYRARTCFLAVVPAMNRWAIIGRPCGTRVPGGLFPALEFGHSAALTHSDKERKINPFLNSKMSKLHAVTYPAEGRGEGKQDAARVQAPGKERAHG